MLAAVYRYLRQHTGKLLCCLLGIYNITGVFEYICANSSYSQFLLTVFIISVLLANSASQYESTKNRGAEREI